MKNEEYSTAIVGRQVKNRWMKAMQMLLCAAFFILQSSAFISCSEQDDTVSDYDNWQQRNDEWFAARYAEVAAQAAAGNEYALLRSFLKGDTTVAATKAVDYVLIRRIDSLATPVNEYPLYTDSVEIHYQGRLIPSAAYPEGYPFDGSFSGEFDADVAIPASFALTSFAVTGLSTALQHMRKGDHWQIIVPYQQAYGSTASSDIPAYSNLIFDVRLEKFWR